MRRCCCDCDNSVTVLKSNGSADVGAAVAVYEWDAGTATAGASVASGVTDAAGRFVIGADSGSYLVVVREGAAGEVRRAVILSCHTAVTIKYSNRTVTFSAAGCQTLATDGARIRIVQPDGSVVTIETGDGSGFGVGSARWFPTIDGAYSFTIHHISGRFADDSGSGTVPVETGTPWAGGHAFTLAPKSGYVCCSFLDDPLTAGGVRLPFGKLKIVTSAGDSWYVSGPPSCSTYKCSYSDQVKTGGAPVPFSIGAPPTSCSYYAFPSIADGTISLNVSIYVSGGGTWRCALGGFADAKRSLVMLDPMTLDRCRGVASHPYSRTGKNWYDPAIAECSPSSRDAEVDGVVNNHSPLSVTFTFPDDADAAWSWADTDLDPESHPIPGPLKWVTLTEELA